MKHDWQSVPVPMGLAVRPRDSRGFPITFVTLIDSDGRPDFTTIDAQKIIACIELGLCGMCGGHLEMEVAFIGGPMSIENGNFLDPPMHEECARYAIKVCPHIAINTSRYSKVELGGPENRELFPDVNPNRPERFGLLVTSDYDVMSYQGQPVFIITGPTEIRWQEEVV